MLQQPQREDNIVGGKWLAVTPLGAVAYVDRELGIVRVVLVAFSKPGDEIVPEHVVVKEALGGTLRPAAAGQARLERVVIAQVGVAAEMLTTQPGHDEGLAAWNLRDLLRWKSKRWCSCHGGSCCHRGDGQQRSREPHCTRNQKTSSSD